ncbi:MAG: hypothetical protein ABI811_06800 [Acidobacteriota bacterium]
MEDLRKTYYLSVSSINVQGGADVRAAFAAGPRGMTNHGVGTWLDRGFSGKQ